MLRRSGKPFTRKKYMSRRGREKAETTIKAKAHIARISEKQKARNARYYPLRDAHLLENPNCEFCLGLDNVYRNATEVHHRDGRDGENMFNVESFVSSCRKHRLWPHENPAEAALHGWMSEEILRRLAVSKAALSRSPKNK